MMKTQAGLLGRADDGTSGGYLGGLGNNAMMVYVARTHAEEGYMIPYDTGYEIL